MIPQESLLVKILKIVLNLLPEICLPKRVGRPFVYSVKVIVCCLLVMVAKHFTVRGLYAFLTGTESDGRIIRSVIPFPDGNIPNRRTFDRRFKNSLLALQLYMVAAILFLVRKFHIGIAKLSLDNRMFEAFGAIWHRKYQKEGIIPQGLRNVDKTAGWGISHYRGWVFGHGLDVFVTTGRFVLPVIASGRSLVVRGNTAVKHMIQLLPKVMKGAVVADSEYFDQKLDQLLQTTGRKLYAPSKYYPKQVPKGKLYHRRKITVEPFYERFLLAFNLRGKLDRKGPQAWPYLVACCFLYQLMVIYNLLQENSHPLGVTHLIRML